MSDEQDPIEEAIAGMMAGAPEGLVPAPTPRPEPVRGGTQADIRARFLAMREGEVDRRAGLDYTHRRTALRRLSAAIRRYEPQIIAALAADLGKPEAEVRLTEILPVQAEISHTLKYLKRWMRPRRATSTLLTFGTRAKIVSEPKGTVLIIAPWNYPFGLLMGPLSSALAAGNAAILKPSELAPATSALVAKIITETFAPDFVWVAEGAVDVAQALLDLPFDHLFFTGSPEVGRKVMAQAARHLTPVTLELGGKSPVIIGPGADLKAAAQAVAWGKFSNAGQTCIAPDHIYVASAQMEAFLTHLKTAIRKMYGRSPEAQASGRDYARIVSERHFRRLDAMISAAEAGGATVVEGGARDAATRFIAPTVLTGVRRDAALMREEIFGPVLPVLPFEDAGAVIAAINTGPKPLALYIFEKDKGFIEEITRKTSSGAVGVNVTLAHYMHLNLPFGGIGNSGMGAAHGEWGFRAFSHEKPVLRNSFAPLSGFMPPYRGMKRRRIRLMARLLGR
ncbi:aldehyde dehydrogenase family protein [Thioclava sp. A2]|uniref:aldehyde dehydrogenase family protein n=1 Tax=Thioclava sp. FCG-A2 TaxID=3080562 RepID=UPI00295562B4|nr:aldehyde dehydrogenase family protein [Thioclava sp. A2]MDV7270016.1 aldehyde dehydrogenase family protein [Thioclava sp. A2]